MSLFQELRDATQNEARAFFSVPQLAAGVAGRITKSMYVEYLTEAYHHVKHTVPLMQAARARLDGDRQAFALALDEYIKEETGHEFWILDDLAACGADPRLVAASEPRFGAEMMVAYVYDYIARRNPMGFFGMVYVLESVSVLLASAGASAVQRTLQLPSTAFRYLTSHGALDQSHLKFFETLMNQVQDPLDKAAIIHVAQRVYELFADVFSSISMPEAMTDAA